MFQALQVLVIATKATPNSITQQSKHTPSFQVQPRLINHYKRWFWSHRTSETPFHIFLQSQDKWHFGELGHTYLSDMLMWLVKSGLEQLCIRSLTSTAPPGTDFNFPTTPLRPSLLEPDNHEIMSLKDGRYKLCAIGSGLMPFVALQDTAWEYNSDGR